ncbi:MAG: 16S rRNA (guanine(966)-N(2))-methyltransferase RsmD [Proteobacteria bacterium]|nr:16S rRNA (guanine(966)-N(2))-methyltransferase RsmD [Pseudomonadota bacterium]
MRIITGQYKGFCLKQPPSSISRPTTDKVRQAFFNIIEHKFNVDFSKTIVLDAFSGSGSLGLEALSRGAKKVYLVEKSPIAFNILKENCLHLKVNPESACLLRDDVLKTIFNNKFDLVFLDPPYAQNDLYESVINVLLKQVAIDHATLFVAEMPKNNILPFNHSLKDERIFSNIKIVFFTIL